MREEPASEVLRDLRGVGSAPIRTFTREEVRAILQAAEIKRPRKWHHFHNLIRCAVHLAAFCGLRYGEIMGLTNKNVDLQKRVLRVRHSLTVDDDLKTPKTRAGVRDVPIPAHLAEMLRAYIQHEYKENPRDLIFRTTCGTIISGPSFHEQHWRPLLDQAGLDLDQSGERFHFHALRHFAASWWISQGVDIPEAASLLGHRTFDTTLKTYAHPIIGGHARMELLDRVSTGLLDVTLDLPATRLTETHVG